MIDLLELEKSLLAPHIRPGGTAVDFTMGNGHDTLYLSRAVGEGGRVFAFDIQQAALDSTAALLKEKDCPGNYTLILDSHANVKKYVDPPVCAGLFNLGYLPGGDKSITTRRESTLEAVRAAVELLGPDGAILIAVYPGHAEGALEGEMLTSFLGGYDRRSYCVTRVQIINSPTSPFFFLIEKK